MPVGVDRTDLLAQIAAEHPVADQRTDLCGNDAAVLDRPEGDAAAVVQHARRDQRAGRADPNAGVATAAVLFQRPVGVERGRGHDLGQENVGADAGDEQVGVLAEPADATAGGGSPVQHPAMIHVGLRLVSLFFQHRDQRRHFFRQHLVVVATERVAGDPSSGRPVDGLGGGGKWVRKGERDHALRLGRRPARIRAGVHAALTPPGEAVHQAGAGALGRGCLGL